MAISTISGFIYECDNCPAQHRQEGSCGHYTNSTPPGWVTIKWYIGEGGVAPTEKLLCPRCSAGIITAIKGMPR